METGWMSTKGLISEEARRVFSGYEKRGSSFFGPAWDAFMKTSEDLLSAFPGAEAAAYDGFEPVYTEKWFEKLYSAEAVKAVGIIDRISMGPDGAVIVDYKKNWRKKKAERFISRDEDGSLIPPDEGYQLPMYILLFGDGGSRVASAGYYGITSAEHYPVTGEGGVLSAEEAAELCEFTEKELLRMAAASRAGFFPAARRLQRLRFQGCLQDEIQCGTEK